MKPWSTVGLFQETLTSANSSSIQTATVPAGTSAVQVTVETNSCRMTVWKNGDPSTAGLIIQKDQQPWFMPLGQGTVLKFASTVPAASVIQIAYLQ